MRLVFVHGISQEGKSEEEIKSEWRTPFERGLNRPGVTTNLDLRAPFYGDRLAALTDNRGSVAIAQGMDDQRDMDEAIFVSAALSEQAQAAGVTARSIAMEERTQAGEVVQEGFPMDRRLNAIVRVLEKISPLHGQLALTLINQAYTYLKRPGAGGEIDAIVRPAIDEGPAVIVGHSLGTIVSFKLLRQLALEGRPIHVPLFVTLGSPLSLIAVQAALGPAFSIPRGVERWLNAVDPDDFIALGRGLDKASFADGIQNILDVRNIPDNPHSIQGYLGDARVAALVAAACGI
jgi:pimeloyl-ACP methyl ester carboxylesterase